MSSTQRAKANAQPQHVQTWQDTLLQAILDCDPDALSDALDAYGDTALHAVLQRREVTGQAYFILGEQVYPLKGALREALGGDFHFENEEARSLISASVLPPCSPTPGRATPTIREAHARSFGSLCGPHAGGSR